MAKIKEVNFRKFTTGSGIAVVAGKNAEMNEQIISQAGKNEYVLHTAAPGSPFCNIKADSKEVNKKDLKETAVFCAKYSQVWKKAKVKKDVEVHVFLGKDIFKLGAMKLGTFGVRKVKKIIARKQEIEQLEENGAA
jgi:hypothetical protein